MSFDVNKIFLFLVRKCYCEGHCPDGQTNGTCELRPGGMCFSAIEEFDNDGHIEIERTYGCLPPDERGFMQVSILYFNDQRQVSLSTK